MRHIYAYLAASVVFLSSGKTLEEISPLEDLFQFFEGKEVDKRSAVGTGKGHLFLDNLIQKGVGLGHGDRVLPAAGAVAGDGGEEFIHSFGKSLHGRHFRELLKKFTNQ